MGDLGLTAPRDEPRRGDPGEGVPRVGRVFRTRGHPAARASIAAMIEEGPPHALALIGPGSVGKATLAIDLAAGLLSTEEEPGDRPCRACRACRLVDAGRHPDLHRLAPTGAGMQVRIGANTSPEPGTIRHLVSELALLPVEGGARVAIVEGAHRMNEDAQNAFLKTLEEPPEGVTIILCADDEERLLATVRSRCVRLHLGPISTREIETLLEERGLADAPAAARLARLSDGIPGLAIAYAMRPEAEQIRGELARGLIDLLLLDRHARLSGARALLARSAELLAALDAGPAPGALPAGGKKRVRGLRAATDPEPSASDAAADAPADASADARARERPDAGSDGEERAASAAKPAASDRRRAALELISAWRIVGRDLALLAASHEGDRARARALLRDPSLLEDLERAAGLLTLGLVARFLGRLDEAGRLIESNVNPELTIDLLALKWTKAS